MISRPTQYLKTVRDSQGLQIIRVELAGVGPGIWLAHIDNDEISPHQADPLVPLHMHGHGAHSGRQHPGPVLPDQDHGAEVGDLMSGKYEGGEFKVKTDGFLGISANESYFKLQQFFINVKLEWRKMLVVVMEISIKLIQLQDRRILLSRNILFP